jgi:hypothetical protein
MDDPWTLVNIIPQNTQSGLSYLQLIHIGKAQGLLEPAISVCLRHFALLNRHLNVPASRDVCLTIS